MARYTGPVCRLCRRERMKLFLKGEKCFTDKCAIERRSYAPGQHGLRLCCGAEANGGRRGGASAQQAAAVEIDGHWPCSLGSALLV